MSMDEIFQFSQTSSILDFANWIFIFIAIMGFSPYGVYLFRVIRSWKTGSAMPTISRRRARPEQQVLDYIEKSQSNISALHQRIDEMDVVIQEQSSEIDRLLRIIDGLEDALRRSPPSWDDVESAGSASKDEGVPKSFADALQVIGLTPDPMPDWPSVRKAWRKSIIKHHPDRGGSEEELKRVNITYEILKKEYKSRGSNI